MPKSLKIIIPIVLVLATGAIFFRLHFKHPKAATLGSHTELVQLPATDDSLQGIYQQGQQAAQAQHPISQVTFLAAGDINLSRNVAQAIADAKNVDLPFSGMSEVLKSTNFNFANLESPVSETDPVIGGHSMIFGAPADNIKALDNANFRIVNLANNHAFDQGLRGIDYTQTVLEQFNITHEGTGDNLDEAWTPAIVTSNNLKICFVGASYASANDDGKTKNDYVARMDDLTHLKTAITTARQECDFVVATMHGGVEYTRTPNDLQTKFAHAAIDDGADIVIGAHPHWVQTIEKYNGKYIFYSLGNFVFDQNWSQDTQEGLTLKISISKQLVANPTAPGAVTSDDLQGQRQPAALDAIELDPIIIENNSTPRPATAAETKSILQKIGQTETVLK